MRTFEEIWSEFRDQRDQESSKLSVKMDDARETQNALLRRAGIDLSQSVDLDDIGKMFDRSDYRRRVRKAVSEVPDRELRCDLMRAFDSYQYEQYQRYESLSLFQEEFVDKLRRERCRPPSAGRLSSWTSWTIMYVALLGVCWWVFGALEALVIGMITLPLVVLLPTIFIIQFITELYRHEVTLQEVTKLVDHHAATTRKEAARRRDLPDFFSSREIRTGVVAAETEES
jgi:hypothetical protein